MALFLFFLLDYGNKSEPVVYFAEDLMLSAELKEESISMNFVRFLEYTDLILSDKNPFSKTLERFILKLF